MGLVLSEVATAEVAGHGGHFSARRLDLGTLGEMAAPVMGFDHYRMRGPTFAPHPHAGFSAISYIFEDSAGGLRNRDSLQNNLVIEPGALVWTEAGTGVVHDEAPNQTGREVHGVQIFVNLSRKNKSLPPRMLHIAASDVPVVTDSNGNRTRVLTGQFSNAISPLQPTEPFDFLDVHLRGTWSFHVPSGRNVLIYCLSGNVEIRTDDSTRRWSPFHAVAAHASDAGELHATTHDGAQILVLSGTDPGEPVATYGPFIMNDEADLARAFERYRRGEMGHLHPLEPAGR